MKNFIGPVAFVLFFLVQLSAFAVSPKKECPNQSAKNLIQAAQESSEKGMRSAAAQSKLSFFKEGMKKGDACVRAYPREAGCYYYRAVNTGLYYQTKIIRYQKGLKKMSRDLNKVIELDPSYDQGGAYRILGNMYLKVPSFAMSKKSITKDLDKALDYAKKAVSIHGQNLDNRLLMAEVLMEQEKHQEAISWLEGLLKDYPKAGLNFEEKKNERSIRRMWEKAKKVFTSL